MTTGHVRGHHIKGRLGPWVTEAYPVKAYRDQVRPGEKVAVEGMALTAADVITGLTIGLGGSYVDLGEGQLRYVPAVVSPRSTSSHATVFPTVRSRSGPKTP